MNKQEYIAAVAEKAGVSKANASQIVDAGLEVIQETLAKRDSVSFVGFGSFEAKPRAARIGKNPRTKEPVEIPATTVPAFKPGKTFKEAVANGK